MGRSDEGRKVPLDGLIDTIDDLFSGCYLYLLVDLEEHWRDLDAVCLLVGNH